MSLRKLTAALFAIMALVAATALGSTATAAPLSAHQDFAAEAERAGLTDHQQAGLQEAVDRHLAREGGTRVALNRIEVEGRGEIVLPLPGAKRDARADCPAQNFCMFTGTNFTGAQFNLYRCGSYALSNWNGYGSWINNQTPGTRARFQDQNRSTIYTTPGAYSASSSYNWSPVWYVIPC
ncbi:peptidase inhibitor family I36 protein [Streptomyces sp. SP18CS02]|uniref:peptidase inhibitor family I36 protein n=1 Tax=Streptomyces sp. SP18CS02 TaxID=3002531 RepID=UPI002E7772B1|nr:peptidase inhibitor family I36 protein [Streptomyces sp. SP18CS02]MEE1753652.1 peptidase inhibitor family I36 protein [Streptomyces sp. SP18CS02]